MRTRLFFGGTIAAVCACVVKIASAVSLDPNGIGQVLVYPYFTVNKQQDTLVSVVNTSDVGKLVQLRFLEGYLGNTVLTLYLFLSPHDVWTASASQISDDGGAILRTSDTTCTYPAVPPPGLAFYNTAIPIVGTTAPYPPPDDGGPTDITRTREGFIEMLSSGDIAPGSATDRTIRHGPNGAPPECALSDPTSFEEDEIPPTDSLYGSAAIVDVAEGTYYPYNAEALRDFSDVVLPLGNDGTGEVGVTLGAANSEDSPYGATTYVSDNRGRPLALDYFSGIDAVSAVFMADSIDNEYIVGAGLGANTDWVVTFPTKWWYVRGVSGDGTPVGAPPFPSGFQPPGVANVHVGDVMYDREEVAGSIASPPSGCGMICPGSAPLNFPYATNALTFLPSSAPENSSSAVFGSQLVVRYEMANGASTVGPSGWLKLDLDSTAELHRLPGGHDASGNEITLKGLPVIGFMAYNIINSNAQPGLLANYGGTFRHRTTSACDGDQACAP